MKYLCLLYIDEALLDSLSADVVERLAHESDAFTRQLHIDGCLVTGERLLPTGLATTVRPCPSGLSITDGPAAPVREQLAGFHLIQARDLNEAIRVAAHMPGARYGCVEVRPVAVPVPHSPGPNRLPTPPRGDSPCAT